MRPFARRERNIDSFGGPALTAREIINGSSLSDYAESFIAKFERLEWPEDVAVNLGQGLRTSEEQRNAVFGPYVDGFMQFLWNWDRGTGRPVYREGLRAFIGAELRGEVTEQNAAEKFGQVLKLDARGWAQLDNDFEIYQRGN
jgi:hypothetical protein